jgi:hypothetical protein
VSVSAAGSAAAGTLAAGAAAAGGGVCADASGHGATENATSKGRARMVLHAIRSAGTAGKPGNGIADDRRSRPGASPVDARRP